MIYLDTNVFVRLLVDDDAAMTAAARSFVLTHACRVSPTVLLEANWVLQTNFRFGPLEVLSAFERAVALPEIEFDDGDAVVDALHAARQGVELEDALHLASTPFGQVLATFDKDFARKTARVNGSRSVQLLKVKT